jgi:hypothetical protein
MHASTFLVDMLIERYYNAVAVRRLRCKLWATCTGATVSAQGSVTPHHTQQHDMTHQSSLPAPFGLRP